jgi:hypothetical protein
MTKLPSPSTETSTYDAYRRTFVEFGALLVLVMLSMPWHALGSSPANDI